MFRSSFPLGSLSCLALLLSLVSWLSNTTRGEDPQQADDERARLVATSAKRCFQPLIDHQWAQGIVVGVVDERGKHVFGFGRKGADTSVPPDGDSVFEIGSITKVFTGILLADMVERQLVSLDDPVNKLLPEEIGELQCGGRAMRLVDLATHTSGLPRMPPNFNSQDPADPYADYTADKLYSFLKQHAQPSVGASFGKLLGIKPKLNWEYSNLGVGLLGHVLERKAERSYEEMILERICQPLEMHSTRIELDEALTARLVAGHDSEGNPSKNWRFACLAPCGELRSTVNDLLKFLAANMELTETPLKAALAKAREPHYRVNENLEMGLNWFLLKGDLVYHSGMTGGYNSFAAFSKSKKIGVVILADTTVGGASALLDRLGFAFLEGLIDQKLPDPPQIRATVKIDPAVLEKYVGKYALVPGISTFTVTREEDRLYAQLTGQLRYRLYPESESKFFYKVVEAQITFESADDGEVKRLILHQNGRDLPATRIPDLQQQQESATEPDSE